jgi:predicted kinase
MHFERTDQGKVRKETDKTRMKRGSVQTSSAAAAVRLATCLSLDQIRRDLNQVHALRRKPLEHLTQANSTRERSTATTAARSHHEEGIASPSESAALD